MLMVGRVVTGRPQSARAAERRYSSHQIAGPLFLEARDLVREAQESQDSDLGVPVLGEESLASNFAGPDGAFFVVFSDYLAAGCGGLRLDHDDVCLLEGIYIRQSFRGKGIGRTMGNFLLDEAAYLAYRWVRVKTLARTLSAIAFYESLRFVPTHSTGDTIVFEREIEPVIETPEHSRGISTGRNGSPERLRSR